MAQVIVKFQDQTKSLVSQSLYTYEQLLKEITKTFTSIKASKLMLHYLDTENEPIRLSSDSELAYALSYFSPLTIHASNRQPKSKQQKSFVDRLQRRKAWRNLPPQQQEVFLSKLTELSNQGFRTLHLNIRLLQQFNGDITLTKEKLLQRQNQREEKKQKRRLRFQENPNLLPEKKQMVKVSQSLEKSLEIPNAVTTLYIDGNNLFFSFMKNRRNMSQREAIITEKVVQWIEGKKDQFQKVILTFDRCKHPSTQGILQVCGPVPRFSSSDDLLVNFTQENRENLDLSLFITSDRELIGRLMVSGVKYIMGSGTFVKLLQKDLDQKDERKQDSATKTHEEPIAENLELD